MVVAFPHLCIPFLWDFSLSPDLKDSVGTVAPPGGCGTIPWAVIHTGVGSLSMGLIFAWLMHWIS